MQLLSLIRQRFAAALDGWVADPQTHLSKITPARDPQHGDYQANIAMPLKGELGQPPLRIAEQLVSRLQLQDICQPPEIAGPGFINLRFQDAFLARQLNETIRHPRLGVEPLVAPRTYVIDYSAPNVAKPMHVGHIRSTVIGDSLARVLRFLGHRVITDNHLGDWGTQFGMIIYGFKHFLDSAAYECTPVEELSRLYRLVQQLIAYQNAQPRLADAQARLDAAQAQLAAVQADTVADASQRKKQLAAAEKNLKAAREAVDELADKIRPVASSQELLQLAQQHPQLEKRSQLETAVARRRCGKPAIVESLFAAQPASHRIDLPAAGDSLRSHARRELLSAVAGGTGRGATPAGSGRDQ